MDNSENRAVRLLLAIAVVGACIATVPLAAYLGLLFLYIEPNPKHMPPDLTGEAVGWAVIGLLTGSIVTVVAESLMWPSSQTFRDKYLGLIIGSVIALVCGATLGAFFAIIQMDSVDGQAMTSRTLAVLAGGTAGFLATIAGIIAGFTLRRFVVSMYRLPGPARSRRPTLDDEAAAGSVQPASDRRGHAG